MAAREEQQRRRIRDAGPIPYGKRGPRTAKTSRDGQRIMERYFAFAEKPAAEKSAVQTELTASLSQLQEYAALCGGSFCEALQGAGAALTMQDFLLWYIDQSAPRRLREYRQKGYILPDSPKDQLRILVNTKTALEDLRKFMGLYLGDTSGVEQIFRVYQADGPETKNR